MNKLYLFFLLLIFSSISFCQTEQLIKQPDKVFIQSSYNWLNIDGAKEIVLIYLEDILDDKNGDLLLQVKYKGIDDLLGKAYNPKTDEYWYFSAEWNLTTKGGGYLINKIDHSKYKSLLQWYYNDLN